MKSMPIGRKQFSACLTNKSQKQKEHIRGYREDQREKVRRELEKEKDKWLKDQAKKWEDEIADDDTAPI